MDRAQGSGTKPVSGVPTPTIQGKVVATCPACCANEWRQAERSTSKIAAEQDPIKRNKMINAAYAQAYQETPELPWFGTAAFASKQVGCGMQEAKSFPNGLLAWARIPIADRVAGGDTAAMAKATLTALGDGNKAVYEELMPIQKFYHQYGIEALNACAGLRQPDPVPAQVLAGFNDAARGKADGNDRLIRKGAEEMLYQEQLVTLQKASYDNLLFSEALRKNQAVQEGRWSWLPGADHPVKVVFDAACDASGAPFHEKSGGNLADQDWRWKFAKGTANKFSDLAAQQPQRINAALQQIIKAGH